MRAGSAKPLSTKLEKYEVQANGCWFWTGTVDKDGYGVLGGAINLVPWRDKAHRKSYEHHVGPIPTGAHVLHKCDTPACINPEHLYLGTPADNGRDKALRGRARNVPMYGADNPRYGKPGTFAGRRHTEASRTKMSESKRKRK